MPKYRIMTVINEEEYETGTFYSSHSGLDTYDNEVPVTLGSNQYIEEIDDVDVEVKGGYDEWDNEYPEDDAVELVHRLTLLAEHLGVPVDSVHHYPDDYMNEFVVGDKMYEVVTKEVAIVNAKEYARNENIIESITDEQIEWYSKINSKYYYREF